MEEPSTQQIIQWFIASTHSIGSFNENQVKNAVSLLYRIPSSRYAVLQWFTQIFEETAHRSLGEYQSSSVNSITPDIIHALELVEQTLNELLQKNSTAWAPILCEWSIEALGQISSYQSRPGISTPNSNQNRRLYDMVEHWMNVYSTRKLMEVYKTCLRYLIDQNAETCMDSLLSTSSKHSPYFDWVVADIGDSFPTEIINRVLNIGFRDYCQQQWGNESMDENECNLKSIVRILEHLVSKHSVAVKSSLIKLFKMSSQDPCCKIKTVLYILQLLSESPILIQISTIPFVTIIDDGVINTVYRQYTKLPQQRNTLESICGLVVHIACQSSEGSFQLIQLLMRAADKKDNSTFNKLDKSVKKFFGKIMSSLVTDLKRIMIRKSITTPDEKEYGIISQLKTFNKEMCKEILLNPSEQKKKWLHTLLTIVCIQDYSHIIFTYFLMHMESENHLSVFVNLFKDVSAVIPEIIKIIVEYCFILIENNEVPYEQHKRMFQNFLNLLLKTSKYGLAENFQVKLQKALVRHTNMFLSEICAPGSSETLAQLCVSIISHLIISGQSNKLQTVTFPIIQSIVSYFFRQLHEDKVNNDKEMISSRNVLVNLSQTVDNFTVVSHFLLESSVKTSNAKLFGRPMEEILDEDEINATSDDFLSEQRVSLLNQHRNNITSAATGYFSNIAETGVIGSGPKRKKLCPLSKEQQNSNNNSLTLTIYRCACKTGSSGSMEGGTIHDMPSSFDSTKLEALSRKLYEVVLSCIPGSLLHSEVLWPQSSFKQYTVERDLNIFKFMEEHVFVLRILELVANQPKALWNCSLLLRAVLGALMHIWGSSRQSSSSASPNHLQMSVITVEILAKGQLIPSPISHVSELLHLTSPYEIFIILNVVWTFIHDHPLKQEVKLNKDGTRDFLSEGINVNSYLSEIQAILHSNIDTMGHLFSKYAQQ